MVNKFYLTAAIPYVNAQPHLGHALELLQGDVLARYHRLLGDQTCYLSGSDENSLKNVQAAQAQNISTQQLCDQNTQLFKNLVKQLDISIDIWQRGSDKKTHWPGVQELWRRSQQNNDIYKKNYQGLYCVGCEEFKREADLVNGRCPEHPNTPIETVSEENYFFRLNKYQHQLEKMIKSGQLKIVPDKRRNETLGFIKQGLEDFSISRSVARAHNWGIPVPDDPSQIIYVWYDALTVYMTGIGWNWDSKKFHHWWPADVHLIGKGINRFHTLYWPAMLLSAQLPLPKTILIHGYITTNGQKMSKSLGNVIDPIDLIQKYGTDAVRYYLLSQIPTTDDGDLNEARFKEVYNADLANGLGNLVQRVAKLAENAKIKIKNEKLKLQIKNYNQLIEEYKFNQCLVLIWEKISKLDKHIDTTKPWELIGDLKEKKLYSFLEFTIKGLLEISFILKPFLPATSRAIEKIFAGPKIQAPKKPLFPRLP